MKLYSYESLLWFHLFDYFMLSFIVFGLELIILEKGEIREYDLFSQKKSARGSYSGISV